MFWIFGTFPLTAACLILPWLSCMETQTPLTLKPHEHSSKALEHSHEKIKHFGIMACDSQKIAGILPGTGTATQINKIALH